jgi:uncharacterized protein (DUF1684 family)
MSRAAALCVYTLAFLAVSAEPSTHAQAAPSAPVAAADVTAVWQQNLAAWRAQREHELAAPDGWLTLIGLEWLKPGFNTFGSASDNSIRINAKVPDHIGMFTVQGKTPKDTVIQLLSPSGGYPDGFTIDGRPARDGTLSLGDAKPSIMAWHGLQLVILERGDRFVLRIKDAGSPTRTSFSGLHWYAPDPQFRVAARWVPFKPARIEKIPTVIGTTLDMEAPGVAEFMLKGKVYLLEPVLEGGEHGHLFFILRDQTSTTTTYGAGRFLNTGLPDHGLAQPGSLTLDFNQLYNPPCAYTPYATCPLPPEKNRLPVTIEAGEQRYRP